MVTDGMDLEALGYFPVHVQVSELGTGRRVIIAGDAAHPTPKELDDLPVDALGRVRMLPQVRVRLRQPVVFEGKRYGKGAWLLRNLEDVEWLS